MIFSWVIEDCHLFFGQSLTNVVGGMRRRLVMAENQPLHPPEIVPNASNSNDKTAQGLFIKTLADGCPYDTISWFTIAW